MKGACGTITPEARACCLGNMNVPSGRQQVFIDGSRKAIGVLYSQEFAEDFARFVASLPNSYKQNSAWKEVDAQKKIQELRNRVCGLNITSYGGPIGLWKKVKYGNIAYDGEGSNPDSPIRINRWGLDNRDEADIANTIAHEAAHRVGLAHPSSKNDIALAQCEPPYVIGNMVEQLARDKKWNPHAFACYEKLLTHFETTPNSQR